MDEDFSMAVGMMLTQLRTARRAIEEVERNTSRYLGFEFAQALSQGASFGAPPMHHGALRVHVININDLAPGSSLGDFFMGLLGGIGNFIGGLVGGVVGGTISGLALPVIIWKLEQITANLRAIVDRLGLQADPPESSAQTPATPSSPGGPAAPTPSGETLLTTVTGISDLVRQLTSLFLAASSGPNDAGTSNPAGANAAGRNAPEVLSVAGERWMVILEAVNQLLSRIQNIVNALIILIPMVIGSIALLVANLSGIRRAILETIQFVLRNVLVLRGVILLTIFETVAAAARLASQIVSLLSEMIRGALVSIFTLIDTVLTAAFDALSTLATTLQGVIGRLLAWLVEGVFNVLRGIGELQIFRTIDHTIRILPALLEPIYNIVVAFKAGTTSGGFDPALRTNLQNVLDAGLQNQNPATGPGSTPATPQSIAEVFRNPPPIGDDIRAMGDTLRSAFSATQASLDTAVVQSFDEAGTALDSVAQRFRQSSRDELDFSRSFVNRSLPEITQRADALADAISSPINTSDPLTGFEAISDAYEQWLTQGGLARTLNLATQQFSASNGNEMQQRLQLDRGQHDRPRASVEIDRVEIVIGDETSANPTNNNSSAMLTPGEEPPLTDEAIWRAFHRHNIDLEDRGFLVDDVRVLVA